MTRTERDSDEVDLQASLESFVAEIGGAAAHQAAIDLARMQDESPAWLPKPGEIIGSYRIVAPLGEGGMGMVFRAEQLEPVQRPVALKLIKPGMDSRAVLRRFDAERQALALMNHPAIARVFDAGATALGHPWFAMELVSGAALVDACDDRRLGLLQRVALFEEICQAVQHAHQKGILHRDLKPSNILVGEQDGRLQAKIIDFGLARATEGEPGTAKRLTAPLEPVGTLEYMSPEQLRSPEDVDTRSDIYALGVILYQLLTGTLPFAGAPDAPPTPELLRARLLHRHPTRPSQRVLERDPAHDAAADRRGVSRAHLAAQLRGDLDWIVLKALEPERAQRYATASELAADLARHRADLPIVARRPKLRDLVAKFVKRNRVAVLLASVALLLLIVGLTASFTQWRRAERALLDVGREQQATQSMQEYLESVLSSTVRNEYPMPDPSIVDVILREEGAIGARFKDRPLAEASIRNLFGQVLFKAGRLEDAEREYRAAWSLFDRIADSPDTRHERLARQVDCAQGLATTLLALDRALEATQLLDVAIAALPPGSARESLLLRSMLALTYEKHGELERAEDLRRALVDDSIAAFGERSEPTQTALHDLARVLLLRGKVAEARTTVERALARLAAGSRRESVMRTTYGMVLLAAGDFDGAERELLASYRIVAPTFHDHHRNTQEVIRGLGELYRRRGLEGDEARALEWERKLTKSG